MAIVRTGVAWFSLVCWLVILIGAGSSEVGARLAPGAEAGSTCVQGHRRLGSIVVRGGQVIAVQGESSAQRATSPQSGGGFGLAWGEALVGRARGAASGEGRPAVMRSAHGDFDEDQHNERAKPLCSSTKCNSWG